MGAKSLRVYILLVGLAVFGLLILGEYGLVWSQAHEPGLLSTGKNSLEFVEPIDFTYSRDPDEVALFVAVMVPQTALYRSMSLYGDGRLLLARMASDMSIVERHELQLTIEHVETLIGLAAGAKLPEFDLDSIAARVAREQGELDLPVGADYATTIVNIALEYYSNGDVSMNDVDKRIEVRASSAAAAMNPNVSEFQAIEELKQRFYEFWDSAGGSRW